MSVLVAGDGGSKVHATITDSETDLPINLTGKTATLAYTIAGGTLAKRTMTVLNQSTSPGQADYVFLVTDLTGAGELEAEIIIDDTLPDMLTTEKFRVKVRSRKS